MGYMEEASLKTWHLKVSPSEVKDPTGEESGTVCLVEIKVSIMAQQKGKFVVVNG
jgi:hypothetical protein